MLRLYVWLIDLAASPTCAASCLPQAQNKLWWDKALRRFGAKRQNESFRNKTLQSPLPLSAARLPPARRTSAVPARPGRLARPQAGRLQSIPDRQSTSANATEQDSKFLIQSRARSKKRAACHGRARGLRTGRSPAEYPR